MPKAAGPSAELRLASDAVILGDTLMAAATIDPGPRPGLTLKYELDSFGRGVSVKAAPPNGEAAGVGSVLTKHQWFYSCGRANRNFAYVTPQTLYKKLKIDPEGKALSVPGKWNLRVVVDVAGGGQLASPEVAVTVVAETPEYARFCADHAAAIRVLADRGEMPPEADTYSDADKAALRAAAYARRIRRMKQALHDLATFDGRRQPAAVAEAKAIRDALSAWERDAWDLDAAEVYANQREYEAAVRILEAVPADGPEKQEKFASYQLEAEKIRVWKAKMREDE